MGLDSKENTEETFPEADTMTTHGRFTIRHFKTIGSTNDYLKSLSDAHEFTAVTADEQMAGRGRRTRKWHSSPGDGLYLSLLLKPQPSTGNISLLSLMSAVAVAETLLALGLKGVDVKWPNDVLVRDRKICGILVEGASAGRKTQRVVIGIGINLRHRSFPEELVDTATSFAIETGRSPDASEVRDLLLHGIDHWYERWRSGESQSIIDRWQELSSYAIGKQVIVTLDHEKVVGVTAGLTGYGALKVKTESGEVRTILAGEVSNLSRVIVKERGRHD